MLSCIQQFLAKDPRLNLDNRCSFFQYCSTITRWSAVRDTPWILQEKRLLLCNLLVELLRVRWHVALLCRKPFCISKGLSLQVGISLKKKKNTLKKILESDLNFKIIFFVICWPQISAWIKKHGAKLIIENKLDDKGECSSNLCYKNDYNLPR